MDLDTKQIISQIIAFIIMLWILKRTAWKPLMELMAEREKQIKDQFDAIDAGKQEIAELKQSYEKLIKNVDNEAKKSFQLAVAEGRTIAQEIQHAARQQAQEQLMQAQKEIQREVLQAKQHLKNDVVNLTVAAANKMLPGSMDEEKQRALASKFVREAEL